jgi:nicotinate-nucleotide--dimethylbenzimidazole phosphoribosyltransferase
MQINFSIPPIGTNLLPSVQQKINQKTKPLGALGRLEEIALQICQIQQTLTPTLSHPHLLVFAGDHGIAHEGVSAYPQEVTWQMVMNFLSGGAAINVFCKQNRIELKVVDAGVNHDFPLDAKGLIHNKIQKGTANFAKESAMSIQQAEACIASASTIVKAIAQLGCNVIGFGEMGIANTSSAAMLMSALCNLPIEKCVGRGTGLSDKALQHKIDVLSKALVNRGRSQSPMKIVALYGGFEIAQMAGAIMQAAECRMIILIDGFIATTAYSVAQAIEPSIKEYCIFCHQSQEQGHQLLLDYLKVKPLLNLNMRLGEGTGVAVAYPIIQSAVLFLNEMASFESAGVSGNV